MKRSELKEIIKSAMLAEVTSMEEAKKVDVEDNEDINIDVEDEVDVDDVSKKSEIEVDSELAGEDADISAILGLLTKAQDEAKSLGDEKLMDQIGNTITYYTRAHVVATNEEQGMDPERFQGSGGDEVDSDSIINVTKDNPAEDAEIGFALDESIKRFQELAGIKPLNELEEESRTDQLLRQADILTDDERDYAFDVLSKMHKKLNPTLDVEKTRLIIDFAEAVLQEFYE